MKVRDLFRSNIFPNFKLLAGKKGLDNEICNVFILDSPDICAWMRGGEFVVGNGYVFHNALDKFPIFLKNMVANRVAALGMKFDRFRFADNYDEIINLADQYNFPLIEIPFSYTWNMIYDEIYRNSNIIPSGTPLNTSDILAIIEERMDPLDLAYLLHAKIKRKILVYSHKLQLSHHIDSDLNLDDTDFAKDFRQAAVIDRGLQHHVGSIAINRQSRIVNGRMIRHMSYKICQIEICVKLLEDESALSPKTEKLVINTLLIFYLMVMDEVLMIDSTRQKINTLLERVLMGRHSDPALLRSQLATLNFTLPVPCHVLLFYKNDVSLLQRELQQITPLFCILGEQMVLILSPAILEKHREYLEEIALKNGIYGIYSEKINDNTTIATVFFDLRESISQIEKSEIKPGLHSYTKILAKISMARFSQMHEAKNILKKYWQPLAISDKRRAVPLQAFASSLIDYNFNFSKIAENLNVHYNTVRNYSEEIEKILNIDLDNPDARFLLTMGKNLAVLEADS